MNKSDKKTTRRRLNGVIVSTKMDKTVVVKVEQTKVHPLYKKRFTVSKKFKAHDPENAYEVGDKIIIEETRPLSKTKNWRVIGKVK